MTQLVQYQQARVALAEATRVDQVLHIRDEWDHVKLYAKQIKDRALMADAAEFQLRIERRLGALLLAAKAAGQIAEGRRPKLPPRPLVQTIAEENCSEPEQFPRVTLEEVGVDRKLSMKAQQAAALDDIAFEAAVAATRIRVAAGKPINLNPVDEEVQRQNRRDLAHGLSEASAALSPDGRKFPCVYADPAVRRKAGEGDRSYENHYPTMSWDEILAMPVADRLLPDAWLFLWLPRAHLLALHEVVMDVELLDGSIAQARVKLPLAWAIARAWGMDSYSTSFVWTKTDDDHPDEKGLGLVVRDQDEILCLFKRGRGLPKPKAAEKFSSNHRERSKPLGHSRKPEHYRRMIASMTGGVPVLELFARVDAEHPLPANWEAWGNQAPAVENFFSEEAIDAVANEAARLLSPGLTRDSEVVLFEALDEISQGRGAALRFAAPDGKPLPLGAGDANLLEHVRGMKLVVGKSSPKLTKKGQERLEELLERRREKQQLEALPSDVASLASLYVATLAELNRAVVGGVVDETEELIEYLDRLPGPRQRRHAVRHGLR